MSQQISEIAAALPGYMHRFEWKGVQETRLMLGADQAIVKPETTGWSVSLATDCGNEMFEGRFPSKGKAEAYAIEILRERATAE